jgi:hypothetical protein
MCFLNIVIITYINIYLYLYIYWAIYKYICKSIRTKKSIWHFKLHVSDDATKFETNHCICGFKLTPSTIVEFILHSAGRNNVTLGNKQHLKIPLIPNSQNGQQEHS